MAGMSETQEAASWIQAGGLLAFCSAVYWEIRQIRPWMKTMSEVLAILKDREDNGVIRRESDYTDTPRQRKKRMATKPEMENEG